MEKITRWLLISAGIRSAFGGIAAVLFSVWICNELQNTGISIKNTCECVIGAIVTAMLASYSRIVWLRRHALAVTWMTGIVFLIDALLVLTGNAWVIVSVGVFATTVVAIIQQTATSDLINNVYDGTDRTVLNSKSSVVSSVATATGSVIGGFLTPDVATMGVIFIVEAVVWTILTLKVVRLMLNYLKEKNLKDK